MLSQRIFNSLPTPRFWLALVALVFFALFASLADAAPKRGRGQAKGKTSSKAAAKAKANTAGEEAALRSAKVAVFAFQGEDPFSVRKHVIKALTDRGLKVDANLRTPDTVEEYRDMGAALDLSAYIHGHVKETTNDHAAATLVVRSAVTGRKITSATFNGFRRGLPFDVEEQLWDRIGKAVKQACVEATKPGRRHGTFTHIEAGTPL